MTGKATIHVFESRAVPRLWHWQVRDDSARIIGCSLNGEQTLPACLLQFGVFQSALESEAEPEYRLDSVGATRWILLGPGGLMCGRSLGSHEDEDDARSNFEAVKAAMIGPHEFAYGDEPHSATGFGFRAKDSQEAKDGTDPERL